MGVFLLHAGLALAFGHHPRLDPYLHFAGGGAMAFFLDRAIRAFPEWIAVASRSGHALVVFALTCTVALFWEFLEFAVDLGRDTHVQSTIPETMGDLLLGAAGALIVVTAAGAPRRHSSALPRQEPWP